MPNKPKIFSPTRTVTGNHNDRSKEMDDLIHLQGPLTEDAVMRTLQARFNDGKYFVSFDFAFLQVERIESNVLSNICISSKKKKKKFRQTSVPFSCPSIRIWMLEIH